MKKITLKTVDSTNLEAFRQLEKYNEVCVSADIQTQGYGRNKSQWLSYRGNIHFSFGKIVEVDKVKNLSLKVVYRVFFLMKKYVSGELAVKWPNDILLDGKKVAGILIESKIKGNMAKVVVGIGINFSYAPIDESAALKDRISISKQEFERLLVDKLQTVFNEKADLKVLLSFIEENSFFKKGDIVKFYSGEEVVTGVFKGFSPDFAIIIETEDGEMLFYSGEVKKVRKS